MNYVMHFCRNKQCNNGWIDKDLTNAISTPPSWKYCEDCCKELGIDFDSQTPTSNLTEEELAHKERKKEQARIMRERAKQNINSALVRMG